MTDMMGWADGDTRRWENNDLESLQNGIYPSDFKIYTYIENNLKTTIIIKLYQLTKWFHYSFFQEIYGVHPDSVCE